MGAVVFAGGGTGGHLYPALAIAEHLPDHHALYIHSDRAIDARVLEGAGVPEADRFASPARPPIAKPLPAARFVLRWGASVRHAREILREARRAHGRVVVVATGGFVCAPAARAAKAERVPLVALALDAVPGKASKWVARLASTALTVHPQPAYADWTPLGPIVRAASLVPGGPEHCRRQLGLDPDRPTLLVVGGSQGAGSINDLLHAELEAAESQEGDRQKRGVLETLRAGAWQVLHQSGERDLDRLRDAYASAGVPARVEPLFEPVGLALGAADLALTRGGAGAIADAWANTLPCLVAPYPHHRDQHQAANAEPLVRVGAAVVETDHADVELNREGLGARLASLLADAGARARMRGAFGQLPEPEGAERAARIIRQTLAAS